jgi:hypothetical protein
MLKVELLVSVNGRSVVDVDVNIDKRTALLVRDSESLSLIVDGRDRHVWYLTEMPHLRRVRWVFGNEVACWVARNTAEPTNGVLVCSEMKDYFLPVRMPHHIVGGKNVIYVSYGEEQYLGSVDSDIEANMVVSFDRHHRITFGIKEFLRSFPWSGDPLEVSAACITSDDRLIISFYGSPGLWLMDSIKKDLICIPGSNDIDRVSAVAERAGILLVSSIDGQKIRFFHFDINSEIIKNDEEIKIDKLFPNLIPKQLYYDNISIHGCPGGVIVVKGVDSVFSVALEE